MAFCRKCGAEINDNAQFCRYCGETRQIMAVEDTPQEPEQTSDDAIQREPASVPESEKSKTVRDRKPIWIAAGVLAVFCVAGVVLWQLGIFAPKPEKDDLTPEEDLSIINSDSEGIDFSKRETDSSDHADFSDSGDDFYGETEPDGVDAATLEAITGALALLEQGNYSAARDSFVVIDYEYADVAVAVCDALHQITDGSAADPGVAALLGLWENPQSREAALYFGAFGLLSKLDGGEAGEVSALLPEYMEAMAAFYRDNAYDDIVPTLLPELGSVSNVLCTHETGIDFESVNRNHLYAFSSASVEDECWIRLWRYTAEEHHDNYTTWGNAYAIYILKYSSRGEYLGWSKNNVDTGIWTDYDANNNIMN